MQTHHRHELERSHQVLRMGSLEVRALELVVFTWQLRGPVVTDGPMRVLPSLGPCFVHFRMGLIQSLEIWK